MKCFCHLCLSKCLLISHLTEMLFLFIFSVWNDYEPNNWRGIEWCCELWGQGLNDKSCSAVQAYICERPKGKALFAEIQIALKDTINIYSCIKRHVTLSIEICIYSSSNLISQLNNKKLHCHGTMRHVIYSNISASFP